MDSSFEKVFKFKITDHTNMIEKYINSLRIDPHDFVFAGYQMDENDNVKINLTPPIGITNFKYLNYDFEYELSESEYTHGLDYKTSRHEERHLIIKCESGDKAVELMRKFIEDARKYNIDKKKDHISIQMYRATIGWTFLSKLPKRDILSVFLDKNTKMKIIDDVQTFF